MLLLQRQRKTIDDGTQDLQQLCNAVVPLRFKNEPALVQGGGECLKLRSTPQAPVTMLLHGLASLRCAAAPVEHVVDGLADEGPVHHELAVDAV